MKINSIFNQILRPILRPQFLLILLMAIAVAACEKDDGDEAEDDGHGHSHSHSHGDGEYKATISIASPDKGMFMNGDQVELAVNFTSDETVHNVSVKLINLTDNNEEHSFESHVHQDGAYNYSHVHTFNVSTHTDYRIEAKPWGHDENGNIITNTFDFHVMP